MSEWIAVEDRLPEVGEYGRSDFVWAHARGGDMFKGEYNIGDEKWYDVCNDEWIVGVTHWRPLPPPPGTDAAPGEAELVHSLSGALRFARIVIKCGEPWDSECESVISGAISEAQEHLRARALRDSE